MGNVFAINVQWVGVWVCISKDYEIVYKTIIIIEWAWMWLTFNLSSVDLWCFHCTDVRICCFWHEFKSCARRRGEQGPQTCLLALKSIFPCQSPHAAAVEFRACNSTSTSPLPWQSFTTYAQACGRPQRTACCWELFVCSGNMCALPSMQLQMS